MAGDRAQRRMAAILAADVAGYSRLMGKNEESTLGVLKDYREVIDGLIANHRGRVFGSAGDSVIAEFASPVEAVRCATDIQLEIDKRNALLSEANRLRFRIGINLGDVVVDGDNLMGDGVNMYLGSNLHSGSRIGTASTSISYLEVRSCHHELVVATISKHGRPMLFCRRP